MKNAQKVNSLEPEHLGKAVSVLSKRETKTSRIFGILSGFEEISAGLNIYFENNLMVFVKDIEKVEIFVHTDNLGR